jgi:hypothetical protein
MKFNIKKWREFYDNTQYIGKMLNDARTTIDDNKVVHPPISYLNIDVKYSLENDIQDITKKCSRYLDACGLYMPRALWGYDHEDSTTWASHESFAYKHLLNHQIK